MEPWYKGYQGEIKENPNKEGHYIVKGKYHWSDEDPNKVIITEIPVKKWTENYKYFLQELMGIEILSSEDAKNKSNSQNQFQNLNDYDYGYRKDIYNKYDDCKNIA